MKDDRASTVHALLDLLESFLPRAVLLENVLGFVKGANSALPEISNRLEKIGLSSGFKYHLHWKLLNAADYGVPQNRRRVIVVIARDESDWEWPQERPDLTPNVWDATFDLSEVTYPRTEGKWADLLPSIPPGENYQWLTRSGGGEELFGYRTKFWNFLLKLDPALPSWTLPASPGPSTGPFHWSNRPLTTRERMRIQSFPDEWTIPGDYRAQTKLLGNATPSRLAWALGASLAQNLGIKVSGAKTIPIPVAKVPLPEIPLARAVPESFRHLVGTKDQHPGHGLGPAGAVTRALKQ